MVAPLCLFDLRQYVHNFIHIQVRDRRGDGGGPQHPWLQRLQGGHQHRQPRHRMVRLDLMPANNDERGKEMGNVPEEIMDPDPVWPERLVRIRVLRVWIRIRFVLRGWIRIRQYQNGSGTLNELIFS